MENGLFSSLDLATFGADVVLFCHVTTRIEGDPHQELLQQKGGRGFPTLKFLDAEGEVLGAPQGRSVESLRAALEAITTIQALGSKAERSPEEEASLWIANNSEEYFRKERRP